MKTSNVLASLLLGSLAAAAPVEKRALYTTYETVVETVVVYTTVWADEVAPTSAPGLFYEQKPTTPASSQAKPTSQAPAYTPPEIKTPSSVYTPPPAPSSSSVYTPPPAPSSVYTPPPAPSSVYTPPADPVSSPPPAASSSTPSTGTPSETYTGDITIYDNDGSLGACGEPLYDDMAICALALPTWGQSTYDVMTGNPTNPWCGKKITLEYNGNTAECTIMDMCPGCSGADVDLSYSVWQALTGTKEKTRYQAKWYVSS